MGTMESQPPPPPPPVHSACGLVQRQPKWSKTLCRSCRTMVGHVALQFSLRTRNIGLQGTDQHPSPPTNSQAPPRAGCLAE